MKITRTNYEIYFIDFLDNNLTKNQVQELRMFLNSNPDLQEEFDLLTNEPDTKLVPENLDFNFKNELKNIRNSFFDFTEIEYLSIAEMENDISENEKIKLQNLKTNLQKETLLYTMKDTKLIADKSIKFPHKNRIKRKLIALNISTILSTAATIMFGIFISSLALNKQNKIQIVNELVSNTYAVKKSKNKVHTIKKFHKQNEIHITQKIHKQKKTSNSNAIVLNEFQQEETPVLFKKDKEIERQNKQVYVFSEVNKSKLNLTGGDFQLNKLKEILPENIQQNIKQNTQENNANLYWAVAEKSIDAFNFLTDNEIKMNNKYNTQGKIENFNLVITSNFKIKRKISIN